MKRNAADGDADDRTVVDHRDPMVGAILDGRFRIDYQLAAGGFGAIYRATDVLSDAEVALKVLLPKLARDPMVVARFRREGKMLAALRDPHTITAYEIGEAADGTLYLVMELLHGESLYQRFRSHGSMPWRRVVHIARGICSSLAEAHAYGMIHRDLKPANIHLETRDGDPDFVKVLDFGIAKIVQGNGVEHTQLTQAGQMIGTVDYMSPEQMVGGELTPSSDIYTLGVVIYEMIAGCTPFADAQTATAILASVLTQAPPPLSTHAQVPATLDQIVARCLEREPANRYADVSDLADALAAVAATGIGRLSPVPSLGFEQPVLTSEATRIDVRHTSSSRPVLDARGPRRQITPPITPATEGKGSSAGEGPGASLARGNPGGAGDARGSQHAIDVRYPPRPRATPPVAGPVGWPPPDAAFPPPAIAGPMMHAPSMMQAPSMQHPGPMMQAPSMQHPGPMMQAPSMQHPGPMMQAPSMQHPGPMMQAPSMQHPGPMMQAPSMQHPGQMMQPAPMMQPPPARPSAYAAPSYDMTEAASYDQMVRRIIWIAVVIAVIAAVVIATR